MPSYAGNHSTQHDGRNTIAFLFLRVEDNGQVMHVLGDDVAAAVVGSTLREGTHEQGQTGEAADTGMVVERILDL